MCPHTVVSSCGPDSLAAGEHLAHQEADWNKAKTVPSALQTRKKPKRKPGASPAGHMEGKEMARKEDGA